MFTHAMPSLLRTLAATTAGRAGVLAVALGLGAFAPAAAGVEPARAPMVTWPVEAGAALADAAVPRDHRPLRERLGVVLPVDAGGLGLVLPPLDTGRLIAEDAAGRLAAGPKPLRIGVGRDLALDPVAHGLWVDVPADPARAEAPAGGRLWVGRVTSMGAFALRLEYSGLRLAKGQRLTVASAVVPGPVHAYDADDPALPDVLTVPLTLGDSALIEFFTPDGGPVPLPTGVQHMYRNIFDQPAGVLGLPGVGGGGGADGRAGDPRGAAAVPAIGPLALAAQPSRAMATDKGTLEEPAAGACNLDVTCYPAYATLAKAVGRITYTSGGSSYLCSGQLLATTAGDLTPYFLTANHCLSTQASATSLQVFWFYQTATCNGADPGTGGVPTSSNSTLLATGATSDYTLLMINGALPAGLTWAGWDSAAIANGTSVVAIHHPTGSFKRITFGTKAAPSGSDCGTTGHIRANWTSGVTEGGSSGSGLFIVASSALIGQLHCGPSACGVPAGSLNDLYGAFNTTYPGISSFLAAGSDDSWAPNHSCATARVMPVPASTTTTNNLIVKSTNNDYLSFTLPAGGTLTLSTSATAANGQVALQLLDGCGSVLASSSAAGNSQSINYSNATGATRTYTLRVYLTSSTRNTYSLTYSATAPVAGNDSCATPTVINPASLAPAATLSGTTVGATADGSGSCVTNNTAPDRWFSLVAPRTGTLTITTCGSAYDTVISVHSACPGSAANQLACDDDAATGEGPCGGTLQSYATLSVTAGTTYRIRVAGYNGASGNFTLNLTLPLPVIVACSPADIANTAGTAGPDGSLDNGDFSLFFTAFFAGCSSPGSTPCSPADIADTAGAAGPDGSLDNGDFSLFFTTFFAGCP